MQLIMNGTTYHLDRGAVERALIDSVKKKVDSVEQEAPPQIQFMARSAISGVMAFLGRKHPELRKPDDMDIIEHAARSVAKMVLDEWEKKPLEVRADEQDTNQPS